MEERTLKIGRHVVKYTHVQTRGVLGGAYKSRAKMMLTHLVFCHGDDEWVRTGCRQPVDNTVDRDGAKDLAARPTCPTCAKRWDKIQAE